MQRMSRPQWRKDSGAVAIVFAVSLLVLMGFIGLGVDVASAYAKSQEVQNAADAGALAAAQSCAPGGTKCYDGDGMHRPEAEDRAQALAERNVRLEADTVVADVEYPLDNQVHIIAAADSPTFFLSLFGINEFTVREDATAEWITPKAGPAMLPLTLSACTFFNQAGEPNLNNSVTIYLPNSNQGNGQGPQPAGCAATREDGSPYPPGGFGWLDTNAECESQLNAVVGTWYDAGSAPGAAAEQCVRNLVPTLLNEVVVLPIFEAKTGQGQDAEYLIQRFAAFRIDGYHIQTGNLTGGAACSPRPEPQNAYTKTCLVGTFVEWAEIGEDYTGGVPPTEVSVVRLVD